jgi:site-specific recombinase XerD
MVVEAAKRLRAHGALPKDALSKALQRISRQLKLETPCWPENLRHALATYAKNAGAPDQATSTYLGHRSLSTTRIYSMHAAPAKVPTLLDAWQPSEPKQEPKPENSKPEEAA